jgi:hypothetical protein
VRDVPCETQEPPNLNAPGGPITQYSSRTRGIDYRAQVKALGKLAELMDKADRLRAEKNKGGGRR